MARPRIVVVGSSNTDLTVIAGRLPEVGETVLGGRLVQAGGGKGANQAVAAARAGADVTFVARTGDDEFGRAMIESLRREGIDTACMVTDARAASGVALIMVDSAGENLIAVAPGANAGLCPADVAAARPHMARADLLLLQLEVPLEAVSAAVQAARREGVPVLLNPAPAPEPGALAELLPGLDYLTPNRGEAARLAGMEPDEEPERIGRNLLEAGVGTVVLTLGAEGACLCDGSGCARLAAPRVDAVDTVGAGDCFCGALAVALAEGRSLREAARFATCAAALSVQKIGAQPSLPRRQSIDEFLTALDG